MSVHNTYFRQEAGASTVSWVLMTALAMGLTLASFNSVSNSTEAKVDDVDYVLTGPRILPTFEAQRQAQRDLQNHFGY